MKHHFYITFSGCALAVDYEESLTVTAHIGNRPIASQPEATLEELFWRGGLQSGVCSLGYGHHPSVAGHIKAKPQYSTVSHWHLCNRHEAAFKVEAADDPSDGVEE